MTWKDRLRARATRLLSPLSDALEPKHPTPPEEAPLALPSPAVVAGLIEAGNLPLSHSLLQKVLARANQNPDHPRWPAVLLRHPELPLEVVRDWLSRSTRARTGAPLRAHLCERGTPEDLYANWLPLVEEDRATATRILLAMAPERRSLLGQGDLLPLLTQGDEASRRALLACLHALPEGTAARVPVSSPERRASRKR